MFNRTEPLLKLICLLLAALLIYQTSKLFSRHDPLAQVSIPALPSLGDSSASGKATNGPAKGTNSPMAGTNSPVKGTNATAAIHTTNGTSSKEAGKPTTNAIAELGDGKDKTNALALENAGTNSPMATVSKDKGTNSTEVTDATKAGTNSPDKKALDKKSTNGAVQMASAKAGTNGPASAAAGRRGANAPRNGRGAAGGPPSDLPPELKARVEKIYQSELFGPVNHPMPPALFGIAGKEAFVRASSGQQGMVKEGAEMGGLKVLKVGVNRVLIEEDGKQNELMIFSGFGGETLVSKPKDKP